MKGMASMISPLHWLSDGRYRCASEVAMPIRRPTPTAMGRLRILAAMTAANAAATSTVKLLGSRPMMGAARTPVNPAKKTLTAQTPADTASGFVPERSVMAGESTIALTLSPTSVKRRTTAPITTVAMTQM